jgi:hypothetical protein
MRTARRLMPLLLLLSSVGACDQSAAPGASMVQAATAAPVAPAPAPAVATDTEFVVAAARDAAARAAREQTLRVQQNLREQQRAQQQQAREAASKSDERCLAGQRMRRVANGWVQAGVC